MRLASCACTLAIAGLVQAPCPAPAQPQAAAIRGAEVMRQPFDAGAFREVRIPPWVRDTTGCGCTLSVMDGRSRARAAARGMTISEMGFVDPSYAYRLRDDAAPPPVAVEAPMRVHSTVMRQVKEGSERLVVHLFNDLDTTAFHALPDDDVPLRGEVVPVRAIRVAFRPRCRIRRIHLEPEGRELEAARTADGLGAVVPELDVNAMVVAELLPDPSGRGPCPPP